MTKNLKKLSQTAKLSRRRFGFLALGTMAVAGGLAGYAYCWQRGSRPVVALADNGVIALDLIGPMEILGRLPDARGIYTALETGNKKTARGDLTLQIEIRLQDVDAPEVIVLPGVIGREPLPEEIAWLKRQATKSRLVFAVGEGWRWLTAAGLQADGIQIVATEGGAAALDAALVAAARLAGRDYAEALQLAIEYDPAPPFTSVTSDRPAPILPATPTIRAGILLYDGMTALDAIGPYEVFSRVPAIQLELLGRTRRPITTDTGALTLDVSRSVDDAVGYDVILIPGGAYGTQQAAKDEKVLAWIKANAAQQSLVVSVCTGALILAKTGLLNGQRATTHWGSQATLTQAGITYAHERFIRLPKLVTAAGVSAGIDVALAVVGDLFGSAVGAAVQHQLPYAPKPPFDSGALSNARPEVTTLAKQILQKNAIGSFIRMTAYAALG